MKSMFYNFSHGLQEIMLENHNEYGLIYGICTSDELDTYIAKFGFSIQTCDEFHNPMRTIHKVDSYYGYEFGLFHALQYHEEHFRKVKVGMYITTNLVLVVCDDKVISNHLYDVVDKMNERTFGLEHIVCSILNGILAENLHYIEDMETTLANIDEQVINNKTEGFNQKTRAIRNQLLYLTHYYEQLMDACDELLEDENSFFKQEEIHHLRIVGDRVNRLYGNVHVLKDYMLQIRETCQSQVDFGLNRMMYIFTIVTTIFLPLTLIVGWYGMNFKYMPELSWTYGYAGVVVLMIVIVLGSLYFFKKKKLWK